MNVTKTVALTWSGDTSAKFSTAITTEVDTEVRSMGHNTPALLALAARLNRLAENAEQLLTEEMARQHHDLFVAVKEVVQSARWESDRLEALAVDSARKRWEPWGT
jgi:hypothetical protein